MHISYITETFPPEVNGVALTVARSIHFLRCRGHRVDVVRPRQAGESQHNDVDECRTPGCPLPMYPQLRFGWAPKSLLLRRFQRSSSSVVHVATPGPLAWTAMSAAHALGLPVTADFRTNFHVYSRYYGLGWLAPAVLATLRRFHNRAQRTYVPTAAMKVQLAAAGFERLEVIGRGVDVDQFRPGRHSAAVGCGGHGSNAPVLLYVGRLAAEKNVELALRAYVAIRARVPQARMVVVGDGPLRERLQARFPMARFVGEQRGAALAQHYASADLFLFPSLSDTFGNVTLEAMACGVAVLAFDTAAAAELVRGTGAGVVVPVGADDTFIDAAQALAVQPHQLAVMGQRARQIALRTQWDMVLSQFERSLLEVGHARQAAHAPAAWIV